MTENFAGNLDNLVRASDWQGVPQIVRLTVRALVETVRVQGAALHELERLSPTKVSRQELHSAIAQKADYREVSEQIAELRAYLQNRTAIEELQAELSEKVSHGELAHLLQQRALAEDLEALRLGVPSSSDFEAALQDFHRRIEKVQGDCGVLARKTASDIQSLDGSAREAAHSIALMEERFAAQINKRAYAAEVEGWIAQKANDIARLQGLFKGEAERLDSLVALADEKMDRAEFTEKFLPVILQKAEQSELDSFFAGLREVKGEVKRSAEQVRRELAASQSSTKRELDLAKDQLMIQLSAKADYKETDQIISLVNKRPDLGLVEEMLRLQRQELQNEARAAQQALEAAAAQRASQTDLLLQELSSGLQHARSHGSHLSSTLSDLKTHHLKTAEQLRGSSEGASQQLSEGLKTLQSTVRHISDQTHQKISALSQSFHSQTQKLNADLSNSLRSLESSLKSDLTHKADLNALEDLPNREQVAKMIYIGNQSEALLHIKQDVERLFVQLDLRAPKADFDRHVHHTRLALEDVSKDMLIKANIKDICSVLDRKANIEDVNQALTDIHSELDSKAGQSETAEHFNEQALINEALCTENTVARWIWKSGELKNGQSVPWDVQTVNTCPDNFQWESEATAITVVTPGLYEIAFGFYSRKKPKVQLLVNGDPVLSAINNASYVIHHSAGRLLNVTSHPSGNVAGLTLIDFLALPAHAKVSVSFAGESKTEGFLGLRKL